MKKNKLLLIGAAGLLAVSAFAHANYVSGHVVTHIYLDEYGNQVGAQDWFSDCADSPGQFTTQWGQITTHVIEGIASCS